jgi:hypothetical protein
MLRDWLADATPDGRRWASYSTFFKTRFVIFLILLNFFICEEDRKSTVEAIAMKFRHQ